MWNILLVLFAVFQGVLSKEATCSHDAFRACIHLYPKTQMDEIGVAPDEDELVVVCPYIDNKTQEKHAEVENKTDKWTTTKIYAEYKIIRFGLFYIDSTLYIMDTSVKLYYSGKRSILKEQYLKSAHEFFDCIKNFVSECFLPGDETTESLLVTGDLVKEICDEDSEIHKDYIHSVECYKSLEKSNVGAFCERRGEALYNAYLHFLREEVEDVDDADRTRHRYCMETAYKIACISLSILEDCDEIAHLTFLEVVHRSQSLRTICAEDMIEELNTMFLDFMEEDDAERRLLTMAFDIKRK